MCHRHYRDSENAPHDEQTPRPPHRWTRHRIVIGIVSNRLSQNFIYLFFPTQWKMPKEWRMGIAYLVLFNSKRCFPNFDKRNEQADHGIFSQALAWCFPSFLDSNPTPAFACAANHLYFLLLWQITRRPPFSLAEKGEHQETSQSVRPIHEVEGWEELITRGATRKSIGEDIKGEMRNAKCEIRNTTATATVDVSVIPPCTRLRLPFQLLPPISSLHLSLSARWPPSISLGSSTCLTIRRPLGGNSSPFS